MPLRGQNPGSLDRRIVLRAPLITRDAIGGAVEDFTDMVTIPAAWKPQIGREFFGGDTKNADNPVVFTIRHRTDINEKWRVVERGVVYELASPPVAQLGRLQWLDLYCIRLPDQATGGSFVTTFVLPSNLQADGIDTDRFHLSWTAASGGIGGINHYYVNVTNLTTTVLVRYDDITALDLLVTGLDPSTDYLVEVFAVDTQGNNSDPSDPSLTVTTSDLP